MSTGLKRLGMFGVLAVGVGGCGVADPGDEQLGTAELELSAGSGRLKSATQAVFWSGNVGPEDAPTGGEPPECAFVPCDSFDLRIDLPDKTFQNPTKPGGVQVAVRWPNANNTLHVFVYFGTQLVAASAGIIATAQSAFIPYARNGNYKVWVAYEPEYNLDPSVPYEALAEVEMSPAVNPVRSLLPDLEFRAPRNVAFATPSMPFFEPDPPPGSTCFDSERNENGAQLCLRFDQVIANIGQGQLEVREAIPKDPAITELNAFQRVYNSNGTFVERSAGDFEYHGSHDHFHYKSFAESALWQSDSAGNRLGTAPVTATRKVSFCIADIEIDFWGKKGDGPRRYFAPDCLFPQASDDNFDYLIVGLQAGWADVYDWFLPGQYVEVSSVPDGFYVLRSCADPDSRLQETDEGNNCIDTHIQLSGMPTAPQVQVLE